MNIRYIAFTKMFHSCLSQILDDCFGVWDYNRLESLILSKTGSLDYFSPQQSHEWIHGLDNLIDKQT